MGLRKFAFVDQSFSSFRSDHIQVKVATSSWEKRGYFSLRETVFAKEQKILGDNEQDDQDFKAIPIVAMASSWGINDEVVGAVRIYQTGDGKESGLNTWYGGRLCVARAYRGFHAIGKALINEAVSRAKDLGCNVFLANIQAQNENYFRSVYWQTIGQITIAGKPHIQMCADLSAYPFMPRDC